MSDFRAIEDNTPLRLRPPLTLRHMAVRNYVLAEGLVEAIDVAMMLGVPLLLTGEPGTGKTQAAIWLADRLGVPPLRYNVKSTTAGSDLLYSFDEVARFRDSNRAETRPLVEYLQFNALGEAILRACGGKAVLCDRFGVPIEGEALAANADLLTRNFGAAAAGSVPTAALLLPKDRSFAEANPEHRVVLIDELDKAPRDTPNDLLFEMERMAFAIPELGLMIQAEAAYRPIVVLTSNSEKELPGPFLRRCVFFDIPSPDAATLGRIAGQAITDLSGGGALLDTALILFEAVQKERDISKRPATAEFLAWLDILIHREGLTAESSLIAFQASDPERLGNTLCAIAKSQADNALARRAIQRAAERAA